MARRTSIKSNPGRSPEGNDFTEVVLELIRIEGLLRQFGDHLTRQYDQTPGRWQVLGPLWKQVLTVPQIARRMGLTRQAVQKTANTLVQDGLVKFIENPDHTTSHGLCLTATGQAVTQKLSKGQAKWANKKRHTVFQD